MVREWQEIAGEEVGGGAFEFKIWVRGSVDVELQFYQDGLASLAHTFSI